jgi:hypothetical protein
MVLLENFGIESFNLKLGSSNGNNSARLLPGRVAPPMMPGIPKFREENQPERTRGN